MPDPNFWIMAAIVAGALILWLIADFCIAKFVGNIIYIGTGEDDDDDSRGN